VYYLAPAGSNRSRGYPISVGNPPANGALLTVNGRDRWVLVLGAPGLRDADTPMLEERVRRAIGDRTAAVTILGAMPWTPAARVADRYVIGQVLLAGDAAHEMTPSGAFGLNTGILDAHNLGWKVAAVLEGWADETLIETYDSERRPVGVFAATTSYELFAGDRPSRPFGNWGVIFGPPYQSTAVLPDGTEAAPCGDPVTEYIPEGRPGHRAPHAWLAVAEGRTSTIDMFGSGFTLMSWSRAVVTAGEAAARSLRVPLRGVALGADGVPEDPETFERQYRITPEGAVLVRPDGHVAWRSRRTVSEKELRNVLTRLLKATVPTTAS
jgi:hypothetical protein